MKRGWVWSMSVLGTASVLVALVGPAASADPSVTITEYSSGISLTANPGRIVAGPDGNLWFDEGQDGIGRITRAGVVTEFASGLPNGDWVGSLAVGPDGNVWFTDSIRPGYLGRMAPSGASTIFTAGISSYTYAITAGPDGNMWFTERSGTIGKITPAGVVTEYAAADGAGLGLTAGPDGNLWFATGENSIGRMTTAGVVTIFTAGITYATGRITVGPDGNLWFTDDEAIGRITTAGVVTEYVAGLPAITEPCGITTGPDGALWFTDYAADRIGRVTTSGVITEFSTGISAGAGPQEITTGPDGNLWFTESQGHRVAKVLLSGAPAASLPSTRMSGTDRVATAVAVSTHEYPAVSSAQGVVLARADSFPDALAGVPLAVSLHAPLLLTSPTSLSSETEAEIKRALPAGGSVTLLGGVGAISDAVSATLTADGYVVTREAGADRDATALAIAGAVPAPKAILLANGLGFADALSAGAAAAHIGGVVLLTDGTTLPSAVSAYISAHPAAPVYAVGGPAAIADAAAVKLVGADRYATSVDVAREFFTVPTVAGLASGVTFPDALAGGVDIAGAGGPLLLVAPAAIPAVVQNYIAATPTITSVNVYGGTTAIPNAVAAAA
jgi:streptogramin lyase/putative cell wall-binding protein